MWYKNSVFIFMSIVSFCILACTETNDYTDQQKKFINYYIGAPYPYNYLLMSGLGTAPIGDSIHGPKKLFFITKLNLTAYVSTDFGYDLILVFAPGENNTLNIYDAAKNLSKQKSIALKNKYIGLPLSEYLKQKNIKLAKNIIVGNIENPKRRNLLFGADYKNHNVLIFDRHTKSIIAVLHLKKIGSIYKDPHYRFSQAKRDALYRKLLHYVGKKVPDDLFIDQFCVEGSYDIVSTQGDYTNILYSHKYDLTVKENDSPAGAQDDRAYLFWVKKGKSF